MGLRMSVKPRMQESLNQKVTFRNYWHMLHTWVCQWPMSVDDIKYSLHHLPNSRPAYYGTQVVLVRRGRHQGGKE